MKIKRKFQIATIGLLLIGIILLIPNTEWNVLPSYSGFICLVLAELTAFIYVIMPSPDLKEN